VDKFRSIRITILKKLRIFYSWLKEKKRQIDAVVFLRDKNPKTHIEFGVRVLGDPSNIRLAPGCYIERGAFFDLQGGGEIIMGENCSVRSGAILATYGGRIRFGKCSGVQHYSVIYGHGGLEVGDYVRIAAHCVIIPSNHSTLLNGVPIHKQPEIKKGIKVGNDVWIAAGCRILDGVVVGDGAVIAAGAVVNKDVLKESVVGGIPARLLRIRKPN
jgi:acetyltransferase-like isoleucine patch superfamily enzyme